MPIVKPTCLRDLKFRVSIVDVVSRVATLKRAGSRFMGLCPFHNEKTPSFHVSPDKGFYKCFGCGKAGDIITFVRDTEGLDFAEAIETLGRRYNVPIEYEEGSGPTREERSLRQELFAIHEIAADHFHQVFKTTTAQNTAQNTTGEWMRDYWKNKRHFTPELADEFKIGAAAPDGSALFARLHKEHFSEEAFRACGLFFINENAPLTLHNAKPRFRGRLMIPIRDHQGRVVAFTARQTDLTPPEDPAREAKYVNSPGTPIFEKGQLLFNLDRARTVIDAAIKTKTAPPPFILVEGQLDALRCWSVGLKTAIAPQGTSITESQLILLRRYHPQVECLFDGDTAGQAAALRYLPLALKAGIETRFLALAGDEKIDPDDLFRKRGIAAYDELKKHALSAMAFACRSLLPDPAAASAEKKNTTARTLFDIITATDSEITRSEYLNEIAIRLRIPIPALARDFETHRAAQRHPAPATPQTTPTPIPPQTITPEYHLLLICLNYEQLGNPISHLLPHDWIDKTHPAGELLNTILSHFEQNDWPGRDHLDTLAETDDQRTLLATLAIETLQNDDPTRVANQALTALRNRALLPRLQQIELALSTHQADSDADAISLIKQRTEIQRQLRQTFGLPAAV